MAMIVHVTTTEAWEAARRAGEHGGALVEGDGFLHLCTRAQLAGVIARHFGDDPAGLLALEVDGAALGDALRWEPSHGGEDFPHLYRALPVDEVRAARPVAELLERQPPAKVAVAEKLAAFEERWAPRVVAELNGQHVKVAKLEGEFPWHHHADEDELFWVVSGRLRLRFRSGEVELGPGEMIVVPRGVEHRPAPVGLVEVVLFEPASTRNTGDVESEQTRDVLDRL